MLGLRDVGPGSDWQNGPWEISCSRETWPSSREFRRYLPREETRATIYTANALQAAHRGVLGLGELVKEVMGRRNDNEFAKRVLSRVLRAKVEGTRDRGIRAGLTAEWLMYFFASMETDKEVRQRKSKLTGLDPKKSRGLWVTRGRLGEGRFKVLGKDAIVPMTVNQLLLGCVSCVRPLSQEMGLSELFMLGSGQGPGAYKSVPPDEMEVAMLLLEPKEEVGKEREAVSGAEVQDAEK